MRSRARVSVVRVCMDEKEEENCNYNLKNNRDYLRQKGEVVTQTSPFLKMLGGCTKAQSTRELCKGTKAAQLS